MHAFHVFVNVMAVIGTACVACSIALLVLAVLQFRRNGWNG